MSAEMLIASLHNRVQRCQLGDPTWLLDPRTLDEVRRLDEIDPGHLLLTATVHAMRSIALHGTGGQVGRADLDRCVVALRAHPDRWSADAVLSDVLYALFVITFDSSLLDEIINLTSPLIEHISPGMPQFAGMLHRLSETRFYRAQFNNDVADLDEAVRLGNFAVRFAPFGHPIQLLAVTQLCLVMQSRYDWLGQPVDLEHLMQFCQFAAGRVPPGDPVHSVVTAVLGSALRNRYMHAGGDVDDLHTAVEIGRRSAAAVPVGSPLRTLCVAHYAASLAVRYAVSADMSDLDEAIELSRAASLPGEVNQGIILTNLSTALLTRFRFGHDEADLFAAVQAARDALGLQVNVNKNLTYAAASSALLFLYMHNDDPEVLAEAETAGRAALATIGDGHPQRTIRLHTLATIVQLQAVRTRSLPGLNEAVRLEREATSAGNMGPTGQYMALAGLGQMLVTRAEITGRTDDATEGLQLLDEALALVEPDHLERPRLASMRERLRSLAAKPPPEPEQTKGDSDFDLIRETVRRGDPAEVARVHAEAVTPDELANLSVAYVLKYYQTKQRADIDEAVRLAQAAVASTRDGDKGMAGRLANLASMLQGRFEGWHNQADIRAASQAAQEAVDSPYAADDSGAAVQLHSLSAVLTSAFEHTRSRADIDRAISAERSALGMVPAGHPVRPKFHMQLGGALLDRSNAHPHAGLEDVDEAVEQAREAIAGSRSRHDLAQSQAVLSRALRARFERRRRPEDGVEMVRAARAALATADEPNYMIALASALREYFQRGGELAEIDEAVDLTRRALAATTAGETLRSKRMLDLGGLLYNRYHHLGHTEDLDESIRCMTEGLPDATAASLPGHLANLANALADRFALSGSDGDLDDAVGHARRAVRMKAAPVMCHNALANALGARFKHRSEPADIDEAIAASRHALAMSPPESWEVQQMRANLAAALFVRYEHTPNSEDVAEIVILTRAVVATARPEDPSLGTQLANYATALRTRFKYDGTPVEPEEIDMAIAALSTKSTTATARAWADAARYWAHVAEDMGDAERATTAYAAAVRQLPLLAWPGLDRSTREQRLVAYYALGPQAASWAITAGRPEQAVELLEQGRAVLWSQILQSRVDLTQLQEAGPELAARLNDTRYRIEHARLDTDRRRYAGEWESLLTEVRALPGFETFLQPRTFEQLSAAAEGGPVVIVNVAPRRCDALIVRPGTVQVVPLPDLSWDSAWRQTLLFVQRLQSDQSGSETVRAVLVTMLDWLGQTVTAPILAALGPVTRVWWCPTGVLSLVPLHAAGAALDQVVSSYTPTLTALLQARATPPATERLRGVVVGQAYAPGQPPLAGVENEVVRIAQSMPFDTALLGVQATRKEAMSALARHQWAHFACHGTQDLNDPSQGALAMHDGMLTVLDLAAMRFRHAEFAYLSACNTAIGGRLQLNDEAINLATALHLAGYRHVVGTLWRISDDLAPDVADQFYQHVQQDPARSAEALHHAVNEVRAQYPDRVDLWASYVHIGP
ncbi:MAG: CHAT domain-containing protein [Kibdelosporangium sp.]